MENKGKEINEELEEVENTETVKKKSKLLKTLKITWKVFEKVVLIALIFISLIIVIQRVSNDERSFLGFRLFRVQTGSMIPKYQIGDVILVKEKNIDKIKVGDDVTYNGTTGAMKGKLVTHQVIDIETIDGERVFHTKGIANQLEDPVIYGDQIDGVVISKMHIITFLTSILTNKYIFYFCGIIPLTIYIFFCFMRSNMKKYEQ